MTAIDTSTETVARLLEDVTPGPWRIKDCNTLGDRCTNYYHEIWNDETDILVTTEVTRAHNDGGAKNMRFIAAARDLVPALLNERDDLRAKLAVAAEALGACIASLERADTAEGVCCCGDSMDQHSDQMWCGHSPVDMGTYYASEAMEAARAALAQIKGDE